jgi:Periplasmic binding protein
VVPRGGRKGFPLAIAGLLMVATVGAGCSRSGSPSGDAGDSTAPTSSAPSPEAGASVGGAGAFGTAKNVCAPGPGTGGSGRGIDGKTIHVGVMADTGAAAAPGLGQEFFDVATAFAKWCNAAGGINGRTIVIDKHDAALLNVAPQMVQACQKDFMLVGGGNALDAPGVAPRVSCKLGSIPAYTVAPQATFAQYQVTPVASTPGKYPAGQLSLLADAYPVSKQGLGIASASLASLSPQGYRAQEAWKRLGYKVAALQLRPVLVDNYRPWIEQFQQAGAKATTEVVIQNIAPLYNAMSAVQFKPAFVLLGQGAYTDANVAAAKTLGAMPPSYVEIQQVPWDQTQYPVIPQAKSILSAGVARPSYTLFTGLAFNSWVLWAQSATACGTNLTQDCVLQKAGGQTAWTAGGLFPPVNTNPTARDYSDCIAMIKLTTSGWVFAKDVTKPNNGPWNCRPENLMAVKSYETGS